jgi:hypothetical protein
MRSHKSTVVFSIIIHVDKVSSRFEFFGELFAYRLVLENILVVLGRESNILSNAYLSKNFILPNC